MGIVLDEQLQPEVHICADRHVCYENVAQVMSLAAKAGLIALNVTQT